MKKILTFLFLLPCFCAFAQHGISQDSLKKTVLAKAYNDPEYKKAVADVSHVKKNVELANKGQLKANYVVNDYNTRLGARMGKKQTLAQVEDRINSTGDKYIRYILLMVSSRIDMENVKRLDDSITTLQNQSN